MCGYRPSTHGGGRRHAACKEGCHGKRDELIARYADDPRNKCGIDPDMDLLEKVTIACGPTIYNTDSATVAIGQLSAIETVRTSFLIGKLGLPDSLALSDAINQVLVTFGHSERNEYSAVVSYMLT